VGFQALVTNSLLGDVVGKVIFDIANKNYSASLLLVPTFLFLLGAAGVWMERRKVGRVAIKSIGYIVCAASVIVTIFFGGWAYLDRADAKKALKTGAYEVVTGKIEHFRPMPYEGHPAESFSVAGHTFTYSDYVDTQCFNNTASHGGPIREGLFVRIAYTDNCILRIEELPESSATSSR
jgi:hypothetical protein